MLFCHAVTLLWFLAAVLKKCTEGKRKPEHSEQSDYRSANDHTLLVITFLHCIELGTFCTLLV